MSDPVHVAENRSVFTYEPDGWPAGAVTGYAQEDGFVIEHVMSFDCGGLLPLVRSCLEQARREGYKSARFGLPPAYPRTPKLRILALYLGFEEYTVGDDGTRYYMRWL